MCSALLAARSANMSKTNAVTLVEAKLIWLLDSYGHQAEVEFVASENIGARGDGQNPYTVGHTDISCLRQVERHLPPFGLPD